MINKITLAGVDLDLDHVEYQVQIQHGRPDVTSAPQASNAQIVIRGSVGVNAEIADTLVIEAYNIRRFTGEISDIRVTHLSSNPPVAVTTIIAIGNLSKVGFVTVGANGWDHQTVSQRVTDVLDATGLTYLNGADTTVELHQVTSGDAQATDALAYLGQLAEWTGATYFDDPHGRIVFESYGNRGITTFEGIWDTQLDNWADSDGAWGDYPLDRRTINIPEDTVTFSPAWSKTRQAIINDITVLSYNDSHETTQTDSASIASFGLKQYRLPTQIRYEADIIERAGKILTAQANPLWSLGEISILFNQLLPAEKASILNLVSGASVSVRNLPQPAPLTNFVGIVEGWTDTYIPGQHVMTLSISDPRYSYETLVWGDVDTQLNWSDISVDLQWFEIITNSNWTA